MTPIGWLISAAYAGAAAACWRAHRTAARPDAVDAVGTASALAIPRGGHRGFWLVSTAIMLLLYLNKQFAVQDAVTDIGRHLAMHGGWYGRRQALQSDLLAGAGVVGCVALAVLAWWAWPLSAGRASALVGQVALIMLVLVRAGSLHSIDLVLNANVSGLRWNWIAELLGIAMVVAGAIQRRAGGSQRDFGA